MIPLPPARPTYPLDRKQLAIAAVLCALGFAGIWWAVRTGASIRIDRAGLLYWRGADLLPRVPAWAIIAVRDFTALGSVTLRNILALAILAALVNLGLRREAFRFTGVVAIAWLSEWLIKIAVARPRPEIVPHLMQASGASFPSGHSLNSAAIYISAALAFATLSPKPSRRMAVIGAALALSALIAVSRVWLGVHYPTDAAAGWLGGAAWAFLAASIPAKPKL